MKISDNYDRYPHYTSGPGLFWDQRIILLASDIVSCQLLVVSSKQSPFYHMTLWNMSEWCFWMGAA